ncbi:NADP-dependent oxidoreductase [Nevskia sp.]|uniref:NADP-dependent oxidoreductase n=1 Tax=Nevskia sp. TaxID=1929292 RepID=UPI0025FF13A3|nr:NADP-dependent oxidoreductase [Nevskia sp.]
MPQSASTNRRLVLAASPKGEPTADTFRLESLPVPTPGPGQMLLRTLWLSLDPYMRVRIYETDGYMASVKPGEVMVGGTVSEVVASNLPGFAVGDRVHSYAGWQDYALTDGSDVIIKLPATAKQPSLYLGSLGMPGFTAWYALNQIGHPKAGETFVVAAATGAVGQIIGQLAKNAGCHVVGIAGGADKCAYAVKELGFDACIDHRGADLPARLKAACPKGIDIYMENVGGPVFDAVLPLMNLNARMPLCGLVSHYSGAGLNGADRLPGFLTEALFKRIRMEGFIIFDQYPAHYGNFLGAMTQPIESGAVKIREHVVGSLEEAPKAFAEMLAGGNFGKVVVKVA